MTRETVCREHDGLHYFSYELAQPLQMQSETHS
jgi:hypothetical protein